jgi:hypothetical protein
MRHAVSGRIGVTDNDWFVLSARAARPLPERQQV